MSDTPDVERVSEADVEAAAEAAHEAGCGCTVADHPLSEWYRVLARAALTAYTGRLATERDAAVQRMMATMELAVLDETRIQRERDAAVQDRDALTEERRVLREALVGMAARGCYRPVDCLRAFPCSTSEWCASCAARAVLADAALGDGGAG